MKGILVRGVGVCAVWLCAGPVWAQQTPVLARGQILITPVALQATPDQQTVPRNIATSVNVQLVATGDTTGSADPTTAIPADAVVEAELRGPAFGTPVTIV